MHSLINFYARIEVIRVDGIWGTERSEQRK